MSTEDRTIVAITAGIVAAHVGHNSVPVSDVATLISSVHRALTGLGSEGEPEKENDGPKPAVSIRASIKPDYLVSMIDGKHYKMLKRHLSRHGYTPQSYRAAFKLPADYPMTSADYAARRSALAKEIGLGRKAKVQAPKPKPKRNREPSVA